MKTFPLGFMPALLFAASALAQPAFVEITPANHPLFTTPDTEDFWVNAVAPADVDGDGDLDLAVLGFFVVYDQSVEDRLVVLRNGGLGPDGRWQVTSHPVALAGLTAGASDLAWGDFDGDGDHDLAVGTNGVTALFRNTAGDLAEVAASLPGYEEDSSYSNAYDLRSLNWGDFDNDGDADLLVPSVFNPDLFTYETRLLRNDGADAAGWAFTEVPAAIDGAAHAQAAWIDDDADGDLDLFQVNVDPYTESGYVRRFANQEGAFTGSDLLGVQVVQGLADWADFDADGDLDILVAGSLQFGFDLFENVLRIYRRDGSDFTPITLATAPGAEWLDFHAGTWADYDSDGDVDLLVTGSYVGDGEILGRSEVYVNEAGTFTALGLNLPAPQSSIGFGGAFTWFDVEGDGDLDYLVAGAYPVPNGSGLVESQMHLYRNVAPGTNAAPARPTGLRTTATAQGVTFGWNAATDDHTAAAALTYDFVLRPVGAPAPAAERLPEPGNVSAVISWALGPLPAGTYRWSLGAVDSAYQGSPRAEGVLVIPPGLVFQDGFESGGLGGWSLRVSAP